MRSITRSWSEWNQVLFMEGGRDGGREGGREYVHGHISRTYTVQYMYMCKYIYVNVH